MTIETVNKAFEQAEIRIKRYERISLSVLIPAVNQLRYAGYHILQSRNNNTGDCANNHLCKALGHCQRASYDAVECSLSELLGFFNRFSKAGYPYDAIQKIFPKYEKWKPKLLAYKELLLTTREINTLTEDHLKALDKAIRWLIIARLLLSDVIDKLDAERAKVDAENALKELEAKTNTEKAQKQREDRRYYISIALAFLGILLTILSFFQ